VSARIGSVSRPIIACFALLAACKVDARNDYLGDKSPKEFGLGHAASATQIAAENIDVSPNGEGLPAGSGTPEQGATVYAGACASCHGANGEGKPPYPQLLGGPRGNFNFDTDALRRALPANGAARRGGLRTGQNVSVMRFA